MRCRIALPGILTGQIQALGRAAGETAPLLHLGIATFTSLDAYGPRSAGAPNTVAPDANMDLAHLRPLNRPKNREIPKRHTDMPAVAARISLERVGMAGAIHRAPGDSTMETQVASRKLPAPTTSVKVTDKDELDVWVVGDGVPVVLIHGAFFGSLLKPLAEQLANEGYQAIWYRRRGYNGKPTRPVPVQEQARDVTKILDELGIDKAHVIGHSAGGVFALALATETPERVLSAAFMDCVLTQVESAAMLADLAKPAMAKVQTGDFEGAAAAFLAGLGVDQQLMEQRLPGSWSALGRDAPTWFQADAPTINQWAPDPDRFKALAMPLAWAESGPFPPIHDTGELLRTWQPKMQVLDLSTDHHFFPVTASAETAAVLDRWIQGQAA